MNARAAQQRALIAWSLSPDHPPRFRPSAGLARWLPESAFRDTVAVRSRASAGALLAAAWEVTCREMPLAAALGRLRYLPSRLGGERARRQAGLDLDAPFLPALCADLGSLLLTAGPEELVIGTIGELHRIVDQRIVPVPSPAAFLRFCEPGYEKLAVSLRVEPAESGSWLLLEHRTAPTDAVAERRFRRYFRVIRPAGAFVSRQLLQAVVARAEVGEASAAGPSRSLGH